MDNVKLLYLTQHFPPEAQAAAFRAYETAAGLSKLGIDVHVLTCFPNIEKIRSEEQYKNKLVIRENCEIFEVTRVYTPLDTKSSFFRRLANYLSYMVLSFWVGLALPRSDFVLATTPPLMVALSGLTLAKLKQSKYILEVRDLWLDFAIMLGQIKNRFVIYISKLTERLVLNNADRIVTVTKGYREHLVNKGFEAGKIEVVYAGVDLDNKVFGIKDPDEKIRSQYKLNGKYVVGFAGNIGLAQGLGTVIEAAKALKNNSDIIFLLVGSGADKKRIESLALEHRLDNIIFVDQKPREEAARYISCFNCCLVTLLPKKLFKITLPSKLFESMAFRKPVLLGLDGEARKILEKAEAGIYFDLKIPQALVNSILFLNNNPEISTAMGKSGYEYVKSNYSRKKMVAKLSRVINELALDE